MTLPLLYVHAVTPCATPWRMMGDQVPPLLAPPPSSGLSDQRWSLERQGR